MKCLFSALTMAVLLTGYLGSRPIRFVISKHGQLPRHYVVDTSTTSDIFSCSTIDEIMSEAQVENRQFIYLAIVIKATAPGAALEAGEKRTEPNSLAGISVYEATALATHFGIKIEEARQNEFDRRVECVDPTTRQEIESIHYFEIDVRALGNMSPRAGAPICYSLSDDAARKHGFKTIDRLVEDFETANRERVFSAPEGGHPADMPQHLHIEMPGDFGAGPADEEEAVHQFGYLLEAFLRLSDLVGPRHERVQNEHAQIEVFLDVIASGQELNRHEQLWLLDTLATYVRTPELIRPLDQRLSRTLLEFIYNFQAENPLSIQATLQLIAQRTTDSDCRAMAQALVEQ